MSGRAEEMEKGLNVIKKNKRKMERGRVKGKSCVVCVCLLE